MDLDFNSIEDDLNFNIIALRTTLPDYKLAYFLNDHLEIKLIRWKNDLDVVIKKNKLNFSTYSYEDEMNQKEFHLVSNKTIYKKKSKPSTLFGEMTEDYYFTLIPELSKVTYLIKHYGYQQINLLNKIKNIPKIQFTQTIDVEGLKSKKRLIF